MNAPNTLADLSDVTLFSRARTELGRAARLIDELRQRELKAKPPERGYAYRLLDDAKSQALTGKRNLDAAERMIRERTKEAVR